MPFADSGADVVAASGVPGRTLFKAFQGLEGVSPMRHLRNIRLDQVRKALMRADADKNVTAIAMGFGFTHMGRSPSNIGGALVKAPRRRYGSHPAVVVGEPSRMGGSVVPTQSPGGGGFAGAHTAKAFLAKAKRRKFNHPANPMQAHAALRAMSHAFRPLHM